MYVEHMIPIGASYVPFPWVTMSGCVQSGWSEKGVITKGSDLFGNEGLGYST